MAMEEETHPFYNDDDDLDDDDDDDTEPLINPIDGDGDGDGDDDDSDSSSDTNSADADPGATAITTTSAAVTVASPVNIIPPSAAAVTVAKQPPLESSSSSPLKKPIDDSRRLFQRLWTDEDEIELLQGFLEYTISRGTTSSGHNDTAPFYDQIKNKLQFDFNKNQLVEKLRRLKKKYRTVLTKMSSGKDFVFKSNHDQSTFEISKKIWGNLSSSYRGVVEFDDDDQSPNPNPNNMITVTPPPNSGGFMISHINLNNAASSVVDHKPNFGTIVGSSPGIAGKMSSRKRPKVEKMDDKFVRVNLGENVVNEGGDVNVIGINNNNNTGNNNENNVHGGSAVQGLIEEAVKNCLSPMLKDLVDNTVKGPGFGGGFGFGGGGIKMVETLAFNAIPLNFPTVNCGNSGDMMDEKWRKQQILELEVYSKRLELVQDQIKLTLEELKSTGVEGKFCD